MPLVYQSFKLEFGRGTSRGHDGFSEDDGRRRRDHGKVRRRTLMALWLPFCGLSTWAINFPALDPYASGSLTEDASDISCELGFP